MICSNCQRLLSDSDKFCPYCGKSILTTSQEATSEAVVKQDPNRVTNDQAQEAIQNPETVVSISEESASPEGNPSVTDVKKTNDVLDTAPVQPLTAATAQSSTGYTQPTTGYTQPTPGYTQPATGYTQQRPGYTQPAQSYTQPATGYTQQAGGYTQQAGGYTQQAGGYTQQYTQSTQSYTQQAGGYMSNPANPAYNMYGSQGYNNAPNGDPYYNSGTVNQAQINAIKSVGSSPLFIIFASILSLGFLLSIIDFFSIISSNYMYGGAKPVFVIFSIILGISSLFTLIAVWLIASASCSKMNSLPTSGFSILKGITIYNIVLYAFVSVIAVLSILVSISAYNSYSYYMYTGSFIVVMLLALIIVFTLMFVFFAMLISSLNTIKTAARGVRAFKNVSMFVAVMLFITAVLALFGFVVTLSNNGRFIGITQILSIIVGILSCVFAGITVINYRSALSRFIGYY